MYRRIVGVIRWQCRPINILKTLTSLIVIWLLLDFSYSRYVAHRIKTWEATVKRGPDGVRQGSHAFQTGKGSTALLMIHGLNDGPPTFRRMASRLADQGFYCRAMRLPGFAETVERYASSGMHQWLEKIHQEVSELRKNHQRVCLVGHSLGGALSIAYVRQNSNQVDSVVLLGPAIEPSNERSWLLPTRTWQGIAKRIVWFTTTTSNPFEADCHDPKGRDYAWRTPFSPRHTIAEAFKLIDFNRGRANEIENAVLMVLSYEDQVIDWRQARQFYYELNSSRKDLLVTKDSGHMIPIDYDWEEVSDRIATFCRK